MKEISEERMQENRMNDPNPADGKRALLPLTVPHKVLGAFGPGLRLYFDFLVFLGVLYFVSAVLTTPLMVQNLYGINPGDSPPLARATIGNLGDCGPHGMHCTNVNDTYYRTIGGSEATVGDETILEKGDTYPHPRSELPTSNWFSRNAPKF